MKCLAVAISLVSLSSFADANRPSLSALTTYVYGAQGQELDLYLPPAGAGSAPYALVVYIHGGGWSSGSKYPIPEECEMLLDAGIAVASIEYRLTCTPVLPPPAPPSTQTGDIFPAQIRDAKRAVRWLRHQITTLNEWPWSELDSTKFGVHGASAGGHLSFLLAGMHDLDLEDVTFPSDAVDEESSAVLAASAYGAPLDFVNIQADTLLFCPESAFPDCPLAQCVPHPLPTCGRDHHCASSVESRLLGHELGDLLPLPAPPLDPLHQSVLDANPLTWIALHGWSCPPMFFAHGTQDPWAPFTQAERFSAELYSHGVPHHFRAIPGGVHRFTWPATHEALVEFYEARFAGESLVNYVVGCLGECDGPPCVACPCGADPSFPGAHEGCRNHQHVGGNLEALGHAVESANPNVNTFTLRADSMSTSSAVKGSTITAYFYKVFDPLNPVVFDSQGLDCFGNKILLGAKETVEGCAQYPETGDALLLESAGTTVHYQVRYRDGSGTCPPSPLFIKQQWNRTNSLQVTWQLP